MFRGFGSISSPAADGSVTVTTASGGTIRVPADAKLAASQVELLANAQSASDALYQKMKMVAMIGIPAALVAGYLFGKR